ncbi:MAG TPA: serine hydrolase [Candidatus Paceibacterota bacterium]|nr:serine hydrolase [Candidatus Paceibacterota bacterium]
MEQDPLQQINQTPPPDHRLMHAAMLTLAGLILAGVGFMSAYGLAGAWYGTGEAPTSQTAAAVEASATTTDPFASVSLIAKSAYVLDLQTGQVLYQQNPNAQLPLASLTKIALMLVVSDALPGDSIITIPPHQTPDGAPVRIPAGSSWHVQDLIDFTLVPSSNEGAVLLAQAANREVAAAYPDAPQNGSDSATLWRMNNLASQLGLSNTYFLNVSGLDLSNTQSGAYGSAHDVAELFAHAEKTHPDVFAATTHSTIERTTIDGTTLTAQNTDIALNAIPDIIMGKTGYTDLAGGNLGVVFDAAPNHPVVAVVIGSTEDGRFTDMRQLIPAIQEAISQGK